MEDPGHVSAQRVHCMTVGSAAVRRRNKNSRGCGENVDHRAWCAARQRQASPGLEKKGAGRPQRAEKKVNPMAQPVEEKGRKPRGHGARRKGKVTICTGERGKDVASGEPKARETFGKGYRPAQRPAGK
jgi:hypothetical protein